MKTKDANSKISLYKLLGDKTVGFPNNFYLVLASKVGPTLLSRVKKSQSTVTMNILGNTVEFSYPTLGIRINGVPIKGSGNGMTWLASVIVDSFKKEASGELDIKRPDSRTRRNDRNDFNKAEGTFFPKIYKSIQYHSGMKDLGTARRGAHKLRLFLTEDEYKEYAEDEAGWTRHENPKMVYYTSNRAKTVDLTDTGYRADQLMFALNNFRSQESAAEKVINIPELTEIALRPKDYRYVVVSGDEVFSVETGTSGLKCKPISMRYWDDIIKELAHSKRSVDMQYHDYKQWIYEEGKKESKKSWEEYLQTDRAKKVDIVDSIKSERSSILHMIPLIEKYGLDSWVEGMVLHIYPDNNDQVVELKGHAEEGGFECEFVHNDKVITRVDIA